MISPVHFILFGLILFVGLKLISRKRYKNHPKGPTALPLLGNVLSLGKAPHLAYKRWTEEYGKIFQVSVFHEKQVLLSDLDLIKKAYNNPNLIGRPKLEILEEFVGTKGIIFAEGQEWQDQRRFTLRHLRDFGFGKNYMEGLIMDEVNEILDWFKAEEGKSVTPNEKFSLAVVNGLWTILTGKRFSLSDPKLNEIFSRLMLAARDSSFVLVIFMPRLAKLLPSISGWNRIRDTFRFNKKLVMEPVLEHRKEFSKEYQENPRDFIDSYLAEIKRTTDPHSSFYGEYGYESLNSVMANLFQAGSETTAITLRWSVFFLALHPKIQEKFQKEIDQVVGTGRQPSLTDRSSMTYTDALTSEILRKSSLVHAGVPHVATADIVFEGYDIPKGTHVLPNIYYVHHDQKVWGDPESFRPERFINPEGKIHMKENLVPFSAGKRVCPGETLARDEIFLFLTSIFQRFEIKLDPAMAGATMEPVPTFDVLEPMKYSVVVKDRRN